MITLLQLNWSIHAAGEHGMVSPVIEASGRRYVELRGDTREDCERRINDIMNTFLQEMAADGIVVQDRVEGNSVQSTEVRSMR